MLQRRVVTPTADFIASWESFQARAYLDTKARPMRWTVGFGQTGPDVLPGTIWTREKAEARLEHFVAALQDVLRAALSVPVTDNQLLALTSLAYNVGSHSVTGSHLFAKLNAGDYAGAAAEFENGWDTAGGVFVQGLKNRRMAEQALFNKE
jgi:lysozyme